MIAGCIAWIRMQKQIQFKILNLQKQIQFKRYIHSIYLLQLLAIWYNFEILVYTWYNFKKKLYLV